MRLCSIDGCGKRHKGHGWCQMHLLRWKRTGDPLVTRTLITERGIPMQWIEDHVDFQGDECLIWPFAKMSNGYPLAWWRGKKDGGHRIMCELAHGEPPTPKHDAAHSCGNGAGGCINQRHLRWATRKENVSDMDVHGTTIWGDKIPWAKLSEDDVRIIRTKFGRQTDAEIAKQFGVSDSAIYLIRKGRNWRRVA